MDFHSSLHNKKHDFINEYSKSLLEFVPIKKDQSILDLGCGTGTLTAELAQRAHKVIGLDYSASAIATAKTQFPDIEFNVCDISHLSFENQWDVVFSHAVFHWIADHNTLLQGIYKVLKKHGDLICEFGGNGNLAIIEGAFAKVLKEHGYDYTPRFYAYTVETFRKSLEDNGFIVEKIYDFDKPKMLDGGKDGLVLWMKQFFASKLVEIPEETQTIIFKKVEVLTKETLWNGTQWKVDHRRLRAIAHK